MLANIGYDVWLGNNRGNKYSRSHISLNPDKDKNFWDFSFHEMGKYDLPAMIDFIQLTTRSNRKITYVGHSQGTSQLFAAMTLLPDYFEQKINGFIALGPVTNLKNINQSFLKIMVDYRLDRLFSMLGISELLRNSQSLNKLEKLLCSTIKELCHGLLKFIANYDIKDDDLDRFIVFISHFPSGSSTRSFLHFAQSIRHNNFATFGDMIPYDFSKASKQIPIALFVGKDDRLATVADNRNLKVILENNNILNYYKEYDNIGHLSFFISISNSVTEHAIEKIQEFSA